MKPKYGWLVVAYFIHRIAPAVFILLCYACNPLKRVQGAYVTGISPRGFLSTSLYLGSGTDSSFVYQVYHISGDRIREVGLGYYSVNARNVTLRYWPSKFDTLWMEVREDTLCGPGTRYLKIDTIGMPIKVYDKTLVEPRPSTFYYKNKCLYRTTPQGKLYRRNPLKKFRMKCIAWQQPLPLLVKNLSQAGC